MPEIFGNLFRVGMGNKTSKRKNGNSAKVRQDKESSDSGDGEYFDRIYQQWGEDVELRIMRRRIEREPEVFILNNLMMAGQFFENFDEEILKIQQTSISIREAEMNSLLPPQKHALMPDVLQDQVAKKVDFIYERPASILSVEPLQPIRVYVVFNNVEVTEENFPSPYCTVNEAMSYNMQLKPSKHKGYALLQRLEVNPSRRKMEPRDEEPYSDEENSKAQKLLPDHSGTPYASSELLYERQRPKKSLPKPFQTPSSGSPAESTSSGYRSGHYTLDSDSDTGYGVAYAPSSSSELPKSCFISTTNVKIYGTRKEKRQDLNQKDRVIRSVMHSRIYKVWYLNSRKFMDHFYQFFTTDLADVMGFASEIQDEPQGAVIYRDKLERLESTNCLRDEQFAIIPCIWSVWPEMANEWLERPRGNWPAYTILEKIKESGCYLIPEGYTSEKITNDFQTLEWEVVFPAAERYLEGCMTHAQVRVYVMALMLQKTFFTPIESIIGLGGSHIRNQMFWMIEEDDRPVWWLESRSGESLLRLLESLYKAISQDEPILPDYFIREKNLFQGKIYLLRTQKQLKRIIENPVMYVLHAMQNIMHSKSFFPVMDSTKLLRILTEDVLTIINPRIAGTVGYNGNSREQEYTYVYGVRDGDNKGERKRINGARLRAKKKLVTTKQSSDQVAEIEVNCAELDERRLGLVLNFFISHFIEVAECYHEYRALPQKTTYIEHAERLCVLLSENSSDRGAARAFLDRLQSLKRRVVSSKCDNDPPETPQRNSDRPIFTASLKNRFEPPPTSAESHSILKISASEGAFNDKTDSVMNDFKLAIPTAPRKQVTMAVVYEADAESDVEFRNHAGREDKSKKNGVLSFTKSQETLCTAEDTYI
ncbi:uncharacterized protein [Fopius arisanus]|uniref:MB21D2 protein n=1 Tax=Fopius arisanus TaxID=64838 RepID=A0A0C9R3I6_9HYME|nr:PREDICTED: uncharacterized protein LOC105270377 [Fopius arisanus]